MEGTPGKGGCRARRELCWAHTLRNLRPGPGRRGRPVHWSCLLAGFVLDEGCPQGDVRLDGTHPRAVCSNRHL